MGFNSGFKGLMLYKEIIAVCSEIHTKHTNTVVWAERRIFLMSKLAVCKVNTELFAVIGQPLLYVPRGLIVKKFYVLPTQCICVLCVDIRTNSDYFPIQKKNVSVAEKESLLSGTSWLLDNLLLLRNVKHSEEYLIGA